MKTINKMDILALIGAIAVSIYLYKIYVKNAKNKKFVLDTEKKLWEIRNNPKLTQEEKYKAEEEFNKKNQENLTEPEKKAIGDQWVKQLKAGNVKLNLSTFDLDLLLNPKDIKK
jgi:uncharacterized membrane protein (DUF106 family)